MKPMFIGVCNAVCLIIILLWVSVQIYGFNIDYYATQYEANGTFKIFHKDELLKVTKHLLDYLKDKNNDLQIDTIIDGKVVPFFNSREIAHMVDVKNIFLSIQLLTKILLIGYVITIVILPFIAKNTLYILAKSYSWVIGVFLALIAGLGAIISIDFNKSFNIFHEIFFNNDLWQLNPETDRLINMFPLNFFLNISLSIVLLFGGLLLVVFLASLIFLRLRRRKIIA